MIRARLIPLLLTILVGDVEFRMRAGAQEGSFHRHAVVSQEEHASDVGLEVLREGGNAVDAAVATAFALAVTHPLAGNIGGGGFLVAFDAPSGRVFSFDFRERAPLSATRTMYLDSEGQIGVGHRVGLTASGVPGTVRGLAMAHDRLGSMPWRELVMPAVKLARDGFTLSESLAQSLNGQLTPGRQAEADGSGGEARLADFPASLSAFGKPDGTAWKAGDLMIQADLADTLERIADQGANGFYSGKTAELIVDDMKRSGGFITMADLADYRAVQREPLHGTYRGHDIYGMGPPSSGGAVILMGLNILENFDLAADAPGSPRTIHRVVEAMRRAFYRRARDLADPDFASMPLEEIVSKEWARDEAATIGEEATPSRSLADFPIEVPQESTETTHLSTIDEQGSAVALTYTLEQSYGCKAVIQGAGFLMNNEMGDFNVAPGRTTERGLIGTPPNQIQPGKRMLSSMTPTLVLKDGKVRIVTGSPGGRTIPNTVLWVLIQILDYGVSAREAVDAARIHHAWFPDQIQLEGRSWPQATIEDLLRRGHAIRQGGLQGNANTIVVDPKNGRIFGVEDRRRNTSKASGE